MEFSRGEGIPGVGRADAHSDAAKAGETTRAQEQEPLSWKQMRDALLLRYHPDIPPPKEDSTAKTREILSAYAAAVAGDPTHLLRLWQAEQGHTGKGSGPAGTETEADTTSPLMRILGEVHTALGQYFSLEINEGEEAQQPPAFDFVALKSQYPQHTEPLSAVQRIVAECVIMHDAFAAMQGDAQQQDAMAQQMKTVGQSVQQEFGRAVYIAYGMEQAEAAGFSGADGEQRIAAMQAAFMRALTDIVALVEKVRTEVQKFIAGEPAAQTVVRKADVQKQREEEEEDLGGIDDDDALGEPDQDGTGYTQTARPVVHAANDDAEEEEDEEDRPIAYANAEGEPVIVVTTVSVRRSQQWQQMIDNGLMRGFIQKDDYGNHTLHVLGQAVPWCFQTREEFFRQNESYHALFPDFFTEIKNPKTGEYFPEAIFLDRDAFQVFISGRWDEYKPSGAYRSHLPLGMRDPEDVADRYADAADEAA